MVNHSYKLYFIALITILIPGLFLGYLSLGTIQNEKELISQQQVTRQNEFLMFTEQTLTNIESLYLKNFEKNLIPSSKLHQQNYFFLATDLLPSPLIKGLVILEGSHIIFPKRSDSIFYNKTMGHSISQAYKKLNQKIISKIQLNYQNAHYKKCIEWIHRFNKIPGNKFYQGPLGNRYYYDFKLLEFVCYTKLRLYPKATKFGLSFINTLLHSQQIVSYSELQFYLEEILSSLTSIEMLSQEVRNHIWDIRSRVDIFFQNAIWVEEFWKPKSEVLSQLQGKILSQGLQVFYLDGSSYLKIQFPWVDRRYQIVARINEKKFADYLQKEAATSWKKMQYILYNLNNTPIDSSFSLQKDTLSLTDNKPVQERILNTSLLQWKIRLYHILDEDMSAISQRKIILLYTLLIFASIIFILGIYITIRSLQHERKIIRMKNNFLSAVTHELKTPITSIRLLSEILSSGRQTEAQKAQKYAQLIGKESNRLQALVENVLDSAKLEQNLVPLDMSKTPLLSLEIILNEIVLRLSESYKKKNVSIMLECQPVSRIIGIHDEIDSILQNLLDNALKYSHSNTTVTVKLTQTNKGVLLSIQDEGIGIPSNQQKLIFNRFYRIEDEMTRNTKGTGLGLALVQQLLKRHYAKISIQSTPKKGTTFNILFTHYELKKESSI